MVLFILMYFLIKILLVKNNWFYTQLYLKLNIPVYILEILFLYFIVWVVNCGFQIELLKV